jgi:hypothetical protein
MTSDLKIDEYMSQVNELRASLIRFGKDNDHKELLQSALGIPELNYKDYEKLFSAKDYSNVIGGIAGRVTTAIYFEKIGPLKDQLNDIHAALGTCALYLKAAA